MKVYLSGPISGLPGGNRAEFEKAARDVAAIGCQAINPHEVSSHLSLSESWSTFMRSDIKAMMDAQAVLLLKGWYRSRGAAVESHLAFMLDIPVFTTVADLRDHVQTLDALRSEDPHE